MSASLWTPGVDTEVFQPGRRDEALRATWTDGDLTQVVVGYVGSLRKRHGVRRLAEVARVPGTRLVVIGDGPQQAWLRSRLPESVQLTGQLKPRHAAAAIASLDVLVQPSTRTTCAHTLREAAACGVPVVAPRAGGAIDVVEHLGTGVLYDPQQPGGLADAVAAVVADPRRQLLGDHARHRIAGRSWRVAVDELVRAQYAAAARRAAWTWPPDDPHDVIRAIRRGFGTGSVSFVPFHSRSRSPGDDPGARCSARTARYLLATAVVASPRPSHPAAGRAPRPPSRVATRRSTPCRARNRGPPDRWPVDRTPRRSAGQPASARPQPAMWSTTSSGTRWSSSPTDHSGKS